MSKMPYLLLFILTSCFQNQKGEKTLLCDKEYYTKSLNEYCISFQPTNLKLDSSINSNKELRIFLDTVEIECLENQVGYKNFVATILIKQYYYHLSNYNQSYDLLSMETGSTNKIVNGFIKLSKVDKNTEMLSSSYIIEYLKSNGKVSNKEIEKYKELIDKATH